MRDLIKSNEWRPFFALLPIEVGNKLKGGTQVCWLEWLERREAGAYEGAHVWSKWVYRFPTGTSTPTQQPTKTDWAM